MQTLYICDICDRQAYPEWGCRGVVIATRSLHAHRNQYTAENWAYRGCICDCCIFGCDTGGGK